jgi:hypothetical protein
LSGGLNENRSPDDAGNNIELLARTTHECTAVFSGPFIFIKLSRFAPSSQLTSGFAAHIVFKKDTNTNIKG